mgnify:CR=1 FL=1
MRRLIAIIIFLFTDALFASNAHLQPGTDNAHVDVANVDVASFGIHSYDASTDDRTLKLIGRDDDGKSIAEVTISRPEGVLRIDVSRDNGHEFATLYWNGKMATIQERDGARYEVGMDLAGQLTGTEDAKVVFTRHYDTLLLGAAVFADISSASPRLRGKPGPRIKPDLYTQYPGGWNPYIDYSPQWFGAWYAGWWDPYAWFGDARNPSTPFTDCAGREVRGWAFFLSDSSTISRSAACASAKSDANDKCSSSYCMGCCRFGDCDAFCILDDYVCVQAGVTGTSCTR